MKDITSVAIDTSKNIFHLIGANSIGKISFRKKVQREELRNQVRNLPSGCKVFFEATGGSHYWASEFHSIGVKPYIIPAQTVKPHLLKQKNDYNDCEAILRAGAHPETAFVPPKTKEQLSVQALIRVRHLAIKQRTALSNQIRGILTEHGIVVAKGIARLKTLIVSGKVFEGVDFVLKLTIDSLWRQMQCLTEEIKTHERLMRHIALSTSVTKRLMTIPGIGICTALTLFCSDGDIKRFKIGRNFSASLGLVPRQHSSGGVSRLGSITKKGDSYLRSLLVHGGRSVVRCTKGKHDPYNLWIQNLLVTHSVNETAVAVANKNARIAFRILAQHEENLCFESQKACGVTKISMSGNH